jgi:archaellum component FlaC
MKRKEEIEQLAANLANPNVCKTTNWIEGYTQCQEDMANEIAELKMICEEYSKDVKALNDMLNSLNKQD